jgi:hypothetical protein
MLPMERIVMQIDQEIDQCVPRQALASELRWG